MESVKVKGIVTRAIDWRENDKLITLVTLEAGKLTAAVRGCKKPNAKLRYAAEPLNFGDYMLGGTEGKYIVTDCVQIDSFSNITLDIQKYYAAFMVLELLSKLTGDAPSPQLLAYALKTLETLCYGETPAQAAATDFLKACLSLNGCKLDFCNCSSCGCLLDGGAKFSQSNGLVCAHCANAFTDVDVSAQTLEYLRTGVENAKGTSERANRFLAYAIETMLGAKTSSIYFGEI